MKNTNTSDSVLGWLAPTRLVLAAGCVNAAAGGRLGVGLDDVWGG